MSDAEQRLRVQAIHHILPSRNSVGRRRVGLESATSLLSVACGLADPVERQNTNFRAAARLYEDGHWEYAFKRFTALADDGHAPAAKLALLMLRYDRWLYGTSFDARPEQVARWAQCVLRATSRAAASPSPITASA
jgi:hypothetical protein